MEKELIAVEQEFEIEIIRVDVEENEDTRLLFDQCSHNECAGVPFLYNQDTNAYICGLANRESIKELVQNQNGTIDL